MTTAATAAQPRGPFPPPPVHYHILDTGDGDWGAHPTPAAALKALLAAVAAFNEMAVEPIQDGELRIIPSTEWCADAETRCHYETDRIIIEGRRSQPVWTYPGNDEPPRVYRLNGRRVPRWKLACSMRIETAMEVFPYIGHPVALPYWHYDNILHDPECCTCATRDHRKKGCLITPQGQKCSTCGALHLDYGNISSRCLPCQDWHTARETYLADWAASQLDNADASGQLPLL